VDGKLGGHVVLYALLLKCINLNRGLPLFESSFWWYQKWMKSKQASNVEIVVVADASTYFSMLDPADYCQTFVLVRNIDQAQ
jgi:hypothetical protein